MSDFRKVENAVAQAGNYHPAWTVETKAEWLAQTSNFLVARHLAMRTPGVGRKSWEAWLNQFGLSELSPITYARPNRIN